MNLIQDLILFFQKVFDSFFFISSLFLFFFIKIIITSPRGRNQLRVRSPQFWIWVIYSGYIFPCDSGSPLPVSPRRSGAKLGRFAWGNPLLLTPPLSLGTAQDSVLRTCLLQKWVALATNKSVWHYFFFQTMFDFFLSHCVIPNSFRDLIFFKRGFEYFFLSLLFKFWRLSKPSKIGLWEAFSFAFLFFLLYNF